MKMPKNFKLYFKKYVGIMVILFINSLHFVAIFAIFVLCPFMHYLKLVSRKLIKILRQSTEIMKEL
jgi:hypothetical protein